MFLPSYCFNGSQVTGTGGPIDPPGPEKQGSPNIFWAFFDFFDVFMGIFPQQKTFRIPGKSSLFASMVKISTIPPVAGKMTIQSFSGLTCGYIQHYYDT